jgi:hypothetical protein
MKGLLIIQTILVFLVASFVTTLLSSSWIYAYLLPLLLGLIPLLYRNKIEKKEILKINIISTVIVAVLIISLYFVYIAPLQEQFRQAASSGADMGSLGTITTLFSFGHMLRNGVIFLILLNVPFTAYYFLNKEDTQKTLV